MWLRCGFRLSNSSSETTPQSNIQHNTKTQKHKQKHTLTISHLKMSSATGTAPVRRRRAARRCGYCRCTGHDRRSCQAYKAMLAAEAEEDRKMDELRELQAQLEQAKADHARLLAMRQAIVPAEETNEEGIDSQDFSSIGEHIFINNEFPENLEGTCYTASQVWLIHEAVNSANDVTSNLQALEEVFSGRSPNVVERDHDTYQTYGGFREFIVRDKKIQGVEEETRDEEDTVSMMSEIPDPITPEDLVEPEMNSMSMYEEFAMGIYGDGIPVEHRNQVITADDAWRIRELVADYMMCDVEDTVTPMLDVGFPYPTYEEFVETHTTGPETYGGEREFFINQDGRVESGPAPVTPSQSPRPLEIPAAPQHPQHQPAEQTPSPGLFDGLPATTPESDAPSREEVRGSRASQNTVDACLRAIENLMPETLSEFRVHLTPTQQVEGLRSIIGEAIMRYTSVDEQGNRHLVLRPHVVNYIQSRLVEEYTAQIANASREVEASEATVVEFDEFKACNCEDTTCPICMDEFEDNKNQMILPCGHRFHTMCMMKNICSSYNPTACPMCRTEFIESLN